MGPRDTPLPANAVLRTRSFARAVVEAARARGLFVSLLILGAVLAGALRALRS